jgi:hypothetical protein
MYAIKRMARVLKVPTADGYTIGSVRWTTSEDAELLRLRAAGMSYRMIGGALGKSPGACAAREGRLRGTK